MKVHFRMVCLGAKQLGVLVGALLTVAVSCSSDPKSEAVDLSDPGLGSPLELAAKADEVVLAPEREATAARVCASDVFAAEPVAVNLYLMIDRSGSMQEGDKWGQGMAALRDFVEDPETSGLRVALRFFGDDEPVMGCSQHECSIEACAQPLVEVAELSARVGSEDRQEQLLVDVLEHTSPLNGFGTPIYPALGGALQWASNYKASHQNEKAAVVFLTDGEPNGCDSDIDHISGLASSAFVSYGVRTYAIGLAGSNERQMDQIAKAGQTNEGIFIGENKGAEHKLLDALTSIRSQAMSCDFVLPAPASGETADTATVNLVMQTSSGDSELYRVKDVAACANDGIGWYFDDALQPTRIHLCPSACAASNRDMDTHVSVVMGCVETRRAPPAVR